MLHIPFLLAGAAAGGSVFAVTKGRQPQKRGLASRTLHAASGLPFIAVLKQTGRSIQTDVRNLQADVRNMANRIVQPLVGTERDRQLAELATDAGVPVSAGAPEEEQQAQVQFGVSVITLGVTTAARFVYPPLILLSLPGLLYTTAPYLKKGYEDLKTKRRPTASTMDLMASCCSATSSCCL